MFDLVSSSTTSTQISYNNIDGKSYIRSSPLDQDHDDVVAISIYPHHDIIDDNDELKKSSLSNSTPPYNTTTTINGHNKNHKNFLQISSDIHLSNHSSSSSNNNKQPILKSILKSNNNSNNSSFNNSSSTIILNTSIDNTQRIENYHHDEDQIGLKNNNIKSNQYNSFLSIYSIKNTFRSIFKFKTLIKFLLVFLISNLGYGTFFSYTSAEALSYTYYQTFKISSSQFGWIFTAYALPNLVMVFASGVLVDKIGPDKVSIMLGTCVTLSTIIGALSPPNFTLMLFSRFLLGFAGESLVACSNTLMTKWFSSSPSLSLYMGILVGWIYSANLAALTILPLLNKRFGFNVSLWIISFVSIFGYILNIIYLLTRPFFKKIKENNNIVENTFEQINDDIEINIKDGDLELQEQTMKTTRPSTPNGADLIQNPTAGGDGYFEFNNENDDDEETIGITSSTELEEVDIKQTPSLAHSRTIEKQQQHKNINNIINNSSQNIKIKISNVLIEFYTIFKDIPQRMWIVVLIVLFGYSTLFGLAIIGPDFLGLKYGYDEQMAALILSSETISSALFSPLCGLGIRYIERRIMILWLSLFLLGIGVLLLVVTSVFPLAWILISGIGYSILNTTIISSIPILVPEKVVGTSYGLIGTAYNTGLVIFPYFLGLFKEKSGNYTLSLCLLVSFCIIASILVGYLKYLDLNSPIDKRLDKLKQQEGDIGDIPSTSSLTNPKNEKK